MVFTRSKRCLASPAASHRQFMDSDYVGFNFTRPGHVTIADTYHRGGPETARELTQRTVTNGDSQP